MPQRLQSLPESLPVEVYYKDKKHSSGRIKDGRIVLYISARLPRRVQQEHIASLVRRLEERRRRQPPPLELPPGSVRTDADLAARAAALNAEHYGFTYAGIRFKRQTSRWGSCSLRTRRIYISERLRGGPDELVDYLIVHELCHLRYSDHGPRFWALVAKACPDYRERRQRLHAWGRRFM